MTQNEMKFAFAKRQEYYLENKPNTLATTATNWHRWCLLSQVVYNATKRFRKDKL